MNLEVAPRHCPDCGSQLSSEAWGEDLCLVCLLRLAGPEISVASAVTDAGVSLGPDAGASSNETRTQLRPTESAESREEEGFAFTKGDVLADRYRVLKRLGRGGMGEVWRAYDLKLRVDVALKSLNPRLAGEDGIELMRGEVRAAREVISPNVCRIFDLIEVDGHELVSMEFVDGHTLVRTLDERGPLDLQEAADLGSQFLAGLEAIHTAGLVHRDIKPENIMLTRTRRVVIMDFGLTARVGEGLHAGTPAYMAPEQRRGEGTDARADVFSAGIVLAEMLSVGGDASDVIRHSIWESVREATPSLPEIPWRRILLKAVAFDRDDRYPSAAAMARTLEKVAVRVESAEDKTPYPGLAAYGADGAEFFFGREAEIETLWKKLQHAHLLGLIGASGAGKSSFVNAGLLPAMPDGWSHLQLKPGRSPFAALRRALAAPLRHNPEALAHLESSDDPDSLFAAVRSWRRRHPHVLLIIDQFEELFTQNDSAMQEVFAELLSRIALDGDVHVLLSMRDDFLMRCNDFPALAPIFSELTPLKPPFGSALRRAIVHPALKCGYRFENDSIVEEMLAEVTRERAALPLIAFTAARLWEERERDTGLLTQDAYDRLGGVAGALAQHAEAALEAIGKARIPIVRELFRNLVTAQGTRATTDVDELLSLFDDDERSADAAGVLQALIDSRLLTSYEVRTEEGAAPLRRVEIVHESLLSAWPRLVRWQSQDADNLQMRDELRQAAKLWDKRGRSDDLLWSGTAYREFRIWRKRYPGRLTAIEDSFVTTMTTAGERARRRRQRLVSATIAALLIVVAGVTTLWRQSESALRRAEAQTLVMQGTQNALDSYPTEALAYAIRSLEIADTREGRQLALEALWKGPPAWQLADHGGQATQFNNDGSILLQSPNRSIAGGLLRLIHPDGSSAVLEGGHEDFDSASGFWQTADPDMVLSLAFNREGIEWGRWSASQGRSLGTGWLQGADDRWGYWNAALDGLVQIVDGAVMFVGFEGEPARVLAAASGDGPRALSKDGAWVAQVVDGRVETMALGVDGADPPLEIGRHANATAVAVSIGGTLIVTRDDGGEIRIWSVAEPRSADSGAEMRQVSGPAGVAYPLEFFLNDDSSFLTFWQQAPDRTEEREWTLWAMSLEDDPPRLRRIGDHVATSAVIVDSARKQLGVPVRPGNLVWYRLAGPDGTQGLTLETGDIRELHDPSFHPEGEWLATATNNLKIWSLAQPYPMVIPMPGQKVTFGPQGSELVASATSADGVRGVYSWPLEGAMPGARRLVTEHYSEMELSPDGRTLSFGGKSDNRTSPLLVQRDDSLERQLPRGFAGQMVGRAFSPDGKLLAGVGASDEDAERFVKVWDVATGELVAEHQMKGQPGGDSVVFAGNRRLIWADSTGTYLWDLDRDQQQRIAPKRVWWPSADRAGTRVVGLRDLQVFSIDLETGIGTELTAYGDNVRRLALSADGTVLATIDLDGVVRVGSPSNVEPHMLFSHAGVPWGIAIDPRGRWVATISDEEIRLWPMPDISVTPLQALPYDELLAKLRALTNVRIVEDPDAPEGWSLTFEPFPGWKVTPPTW